MVVGPEKVKIPEQLAPILGVVQREVYVMAYNLTEDGVLIWAQVRPQTALHYSGKLDHVASGVVRYEEKRKDAVPRLVSEEMERARPHVAPGLAQAGVLLHHPRRGRRPP